MERGAVGRFVAHVLYGCFMAGHGLFIFVTWFISWNIPFRIFSFDIFLNNRLSLILICFRNYICVYVWCVSFETQLAAHNRSILFHLCYPTTDIFIALWLMDFFWNWTYFSWSWLCIVTVMWNSYSFHFSVNNFVQD